MNEPTITEYLAVIGLFFLFLVWIACMREPNYVPDDAYPDELPTSENIRTI